MANEEAPPPVGTVRPRRFADPEGGGEVLPPPPVAVTPPNFQTPIEGPGYFAPQPPAPVVPVPPAPPEPPRTPDPVIGPPAAPEILPPYVQLPQDWWQLLPIETRAALEEILAGLQSDLDAAEARIAAIPRGNDGTNGTNGTNGKDGTNGRDGANGALFVSTPEFAKLDERITSGASNIVALVNRTNALQSNINTAVDIATQARRDAAALRLIVESIAANPNLVPVAPTASQLATAVRDYLATNPISGGTNGTNGTNGLPGANATDAQVRAAVDAYIKANPVTGGGTGVPVVGPPGPQGPAGPAGPAVSPEILTGIVGEVFAGVSGFLANPTDYIWNVIILGIKARAGALLDALTAED